MLSIFRQNYKMNKHNITNNTNYGKFEWKQCSFGFKKARISFRVNLECENRFLPFTTSLRFIAFIWRKAIVFHFWMAQVLPTYINDGMVLTKPIRETEKWNEKKKHNNIVFVHMLE